MIARFSFLAGALLAVGVLTVHAAARGAEALPRPPAKSCSTKEKLAGAHGAAIDGELADYLVLDETAVAPAPPGLSYEEAATLPTAGLTAWMAVNGHRAVRTGDVVLVQGTGGVSTLALQFAAALGAHVGSCNERRRSARATASITGPRRLGQPACSSLRAAMARISSSMSAARHPYPSP